MADTNINNILQEIDVDHHNREQMMKQVVVAYCDMLTTSDLQRQDVADQLLRITQAATITHNTRLDKSQKHLKWEIPKQIEPTQLALYLFMNIENITDVISNDIDFMRLVWDYAIGYSKHDIGRVKNEIVRLQKTIEPFEKE